MAELAKKILEQLYKAGVLDWYTYTTAKDKLISDLVKLLEKEMQNDQK